MLPDFIPDETTEITIADSDIDVYMQVDWDKYSKLSGEELTTGSQDTKDWPHSYKMSGNILHTNAVAKCTIPEGSIYYKNKRDHYVSNTIKIENVLQKYTELTYQALEKPDILNRDLKSLKQFAEQSSEFSGCRVTIIDTAGYVLADSEINIEQLFLIVMALY